MMNILMNTRAVLLAMLILLPDLAAAQPAAPPRVSAGAGAGAAFPFHGDFDFTPWAWEADVRVAVARHVILELAVGEWRHSETRVSRNIHVTMPPSGVIGRLEQTTVRVQRIWQANLLFSGAVGRVRVTGGGGVGALQHERSTEQVLSDCSLERLCNAFQSDVSNGSGSAQAVGGAEVRLAGGLAAYGQVRFTVPMTDPGSSDLRVTSGLRWGFGR